VGRTGGREVGRGGCGLTVGRGGCGLTVGRGGCGLAVGRGGCGLALGRGGCGLALGRGCGGLALGRGDEACCATTKLGLGPISDAGAAIVAANPIVRKADNRRTGVMVRTPSIRCLPNLARAEPSSTVNFPRARTTCGKTACLVGLQCALDAVLQIGKCVRLGSISVSVAVD
jgi:hypothetical protein